ncbi:hypothetical protein DDB_G0271244 [Dictyostelium discoideum AX4]|uniref:FNIP repeat-containing protein n=1 Tax=Dictyostelium discoideum TaxID=44689 RepID=Q55BA3_DICDI|nr:hypothetical protein DDB_G0271244 [Dictyostelium discoideum AX4]EAL71752.1 hypothetical protein DDB_G0271244 [Dictyostelium discoideum AX4]|eukprot:XP_645709.1 hypothetical protein DDB_G0271244 [Dictyostelium discoideum AX4]
MDLLFFKVWRNKYLNNYIYKIVEEFEYYKQRKPIKNSKILRKLKNGQYLTNIILNSKSVFIDGYELPETISILELGGKMVSPLKENNITPYISKLIISSVSINYSIPSSILPTHSITHLKFCNQCEINIEFQIGTLPPSLRTLYLGNYKHPLKEGILPTGLLKLTIHSYEYPIKKNDIPNTVKVLTYGKKFIGCKPANSDTNTNSNINTNTNKINKLLNIVIPNSVEELSILFDIGYIPILADSIRKLTIGRLNFNLEFTDKLNKRTFPYNYCFLPENITDLTFLQIIPLYNTYGGKWIINDDILPKSLISLKFGFLCSIEFLNNSLSSLKNLKELELLNSYFLPKPTSTKSKSSTTMMTQLFKFEIPKSIEKLKLSRDFSILNSIVNKELLLPLLSDLSIGLYDDNDDDKFNYLGSLPETIKILEIQISNLGIERSFSSITSLKISGINFQNINIVPFKAPLLKSLEFDDNFNNKICIDFIPKSVTTLIFGNRFNRPLSSLNLPQSLTKLTLGCRFPKENINQLYNQLPNLKLINFKKKFELL